MVEVKCKLKDIEKAARFCFLLPVYLTIAARSSQLVLCYHKHHNPKHIVGTLTLELERRLKLNVYEVGLLL